MATIKFRRDTASRWVLANPVLAPGEPAYEKDTGRFKIGDGTSRWLDLEYFISDNGEIAQEQDILDHINSATPHPVYDEGPSLVILYENAKV